MKVLFEEEQRFTQWWLWLLLLAFPAFAVYATITQVVLGHVVGDHPMSNGGLILFTAFSFLFSMFFRMMFLKTTIDTEKISMRFFPLLKRSWNFQEIQSCSVVNYGFVGYGIRFSSAFGTIYNMRGKMGLAITMKNGNKICIGTQRPEEMKKALEWLS